MSEIDEIKDFFAKFGAQLPPDLERQRQAFAQRAQTAPEGWSIADAA